MAELAKALTRGKIQECTTWWETQCPVVVEDYIRNAIQAAVDQGRFKVKVQVGRAITDHINDAWDGKYRAYQAALDSVIHKLELEKFTCRRLFSWFDYPEIWIFGESWQYASTGFHYAEGRSLEIKWE